MTRRPGAVLRVSRMRACVPRDRFDKLARQRSDPAHALQEIQDHALAGKNHARIVPDHRDRLPFVQPHSVKNLRMGRDFVVRGDRTIERGVYIEDASDASDAGQNAILLGQDRCRRPLVGIDAGVAGRIARRPVFEQRVLENRRKPS